MLSEEKIKEAYLMVTLAIAGLLPELIKKNIPVECLHTAITMFAECSTNALETINDRKHIEEGEDD